MTTIQAPKRALLAVLAALAALLVGASPSFAASDSWYVNKQTNKPVIYQTNLDYESAVFSKTQQSTYVPSNALITQVYWNWKVIDSWPSGTQLTVLLCTGDTGTANCLSVKDPNSTAMNGASVTRAFQGLSASTNFHYVYRVQGSTTRTIPAVNNGGSSVQVNFDY